ncbi:MAG: T9SS type A sorting domain-containing protein [bacterium]
MKTLVLIMMGLVALPLANHLGIVSVPQIAIDLKPIKPLDLQEPLECINTGISTTPPWLLYRDPPWSTGIQVPDVYNRDDRMLSMAVGPNGRIYVAYTAIYNASPVLYGFGLASSTDNGITWDNRVYRTSGTTYSEFYPEITVTNDGKIWMWGTVNGGTIVNCPAFLRSSATCYNNPDSLRGFSYFNIPYRLYPECVNWGNGNQLLFAQYTVDRTGNNDSVFCVFSYDSTNWWVFTIRPSGGNPGMTSIGLGVSGTDTILIHGIEYFDAAGNDWDVVWYLDTLNSSSGNLYGWATNNPNNDRYPSVFCTNRYAYIAIQADVGSGDNDILFNYSTDYGATWNGTLIDITNDPANETYPRLCGFATTICAGYVYNGNSARFNYSIWNGQEGTWQPAEVISDNTTVSNSYHSVALLWTPSFVHATWEDTRNSGTDGIEIYASRRDVPIGVSESDFTRFSKLRLSPNPFKDKVSISLNPELHGKNLMLKVYDLSGKLIKTQKVSANTPSVTWNATDNYGRKVPAGIYVLSVESDSKIFTQKAVLLRK